MTAERVQDMMAVVPTNCCALGAARGKYYLLVTLNSQNKACSLRVVLQLNYLEMNLSRRGCHNEAVQ